MSDLYEVYVKTDQKNNIISVNSSVFVSSDWGIKIDEGTGDKYHHAQGNYFNESIYTKDGFQRYKLSEEKPVKRSDEEIDRDRLSVVKQQKIAKSKIDLQNHLLSHPLQWTDGETYSITEDKQNQLMGTLMTAQLDRKKPEWNTSGGVCREWELAELTGLAVAIKDRVKALVKYQQTKEVMMNKAKTLEELNSIIVNYDEVK